MSRSHRVIGLLVSLALVGGAAIAAPSTGVAKPPKCPKGSHYSKAKKKCVKNKKPGHKVSCGILPGVADELTARNVSCHDAQFVAKHFLCNPSSCKTGHSVDSQGRSYACTVQAQQQPSRRVRLSRTCRHQPGSLEVSWSIVRSPG
jgi:hypothetical protein